MKLKIESMIVFHLVNLLELGLIVQCLITVFLSRFRTELTQKKVNEKLFKELNKQLEKHKIIVKTGVIIDASIVDIPLMPKGKPTYEVCDEREATDEN